MTTTRAHTSAKVRRYFELTSRAASSSSEHDSTDILDPRIGLTPEQRSFHDVATAFARDVLAPHAARHDADKTFPEEALREAAALGFGALYASEEFGGSALSRLDGSVIVEALAGADVSTTAYLTVRCWFAVSCITGARCTRIVFAPVLLTPAMQIHNMCAWSIDAHGTPEQVRGKAAASGDDDVDEHVLYAPDAPLVCDRVVSRVFVEPHANRLSPRTRAHPLRAQRAQYIPRLATMEHFASYALTEVRLSLICVHMSSVPVPGVHLLAHNASVTCDLHHLCSPQPGRMLLQSQRVRYAMAAGTTFSMVCAALK